jgi:hypothetical protein
MFVVLNGERLEPTLPHMSASAVVPMVPTHLGCQQPLHYGDQIK